MGHYEDFRFDIENNPALGQFVAFREGASTAAPLLPAGNTVVLEFPAIAGRVEISVEALDPREPSRVRRVGPIANPEFISEWNRLPFTVELFAPGGGRVQVWRDDTAGWSRVLDASFEHVVPVPAPEPRTWKVHVTNRAAVQASVRLGAGGVVHRTPLRTQPLATSLLNHAYLVVLDALTPSVELTGDRLVWSFGEELQAYFGNEVPQLGRHEEPLQGGVTAHGGSLSSFGLRATSGQSLLDAVRQRWAPDDERRLEWERNVRPDVPTIHLEAAFSDVTWSYEKDLKIYDFRTRGVLRKLVVDVFIALSAPMSGGHVLVLSPATFDGGALDEARDLGIIPELGQLIEDKLPGIIRPVTPHIGRYLGDALARLCLRNAMFLSVSADGSAWNVRYALAPTGGGGGLTHGHVPIDDDGGILGDADPVIHLEGGILEGGIRGAAEGGQPVEPPPDSTLGQIPADFVVRGAPEHLARLDQIDTIVVLMMENRSFDHMLGHLRQLRGDAYEGLTGTEQNRVANRQEPVRVRPARDVMQGVIDSIGRRVPVTAIQVSPQHDFTNVAQQIADGAMSGFAQDVEERATGAADLVMTFYTDAELKTYYRLAEWFAVCDHWFAAHPGATWPNRWAMLTGRTPSPVNPEVDDPDLAYVKGETIFSWLSTNDIEWRVFESDLSIVRTFNRHRIDSERILPLGLRPSGIGIGEDNTFWSLALRGLLPPVVFLEPNFSDIPPLQTANDDLAPVDLRKGQLLVADIVDTLMASPQWERTMFVITYDEHGGFYDHVPPPGTPLGPAEWQGKVPRIHPQGADHLGVRVPALVVSPMVSKGSVCKEVFDHTSIIKTILLRHRARLHANVFTAFGPRVNEASHLGQVLDLDAPRADKPDPLTSLWFSGAPITVPEGGDGTARGLSNQDDFPRTLRRAFLPTRG